MTDRQPTRDDVVEEMARGICVARYGHLRGYEGREAQYHKEAQAALAAQEALGLVLVPREATPKMIAATWHHGIDRNGGIESQNTRNERIYRAMLAASPIAGAPE